LEKIRSRPSGLAGFSAEDFSPHPIVINARRMNPKKILLLVRPIITVWLVVGKQTRLAAIRKAARFCLFKKLKSGAKS
jgi:hypothetical protein